MHDLVSCSHRTRAQVGRSRSILPRELANHAGSERAKAALKRRRGHSRVYSMQTSEKRAILLAELAGKRSRRRTGADDRISDLARASRTFQTLGAMNRVRHDGGADLGGAEAQLDGANDRVCVQTSATVNSNVNSELSCTLRTVQLQ